MCEIKTSDIRAWQNELIKQRYAPTYLKSINNQLAAFFNYAVRYYDLKDNPCRKAGSIGKSKADDMEFWTKQEFKQFLPSMDKKPEARMAFMLLYWTGMRMQTNLSELVKQLGQQEVTLTAEGLEDMRNDCMDMLQAIIEMLDGAKYLWQGVQTDKEKVLTAATVRTCGNKRKSLLHL